MLTMHLRLGAHLSWYAPQRLAALDIPLPGPTALREVALALNLPLEEIAIAAVNGELVALDSAQVVDTDRVMLAPPIGAG